MRVCLLVCTIIALVYGDATIVQQCEHRKWNPFTTHVAALVLARGGSKGIPMKNLACVGGKSLLSRSLRTLEQVNNFHSIWVSTDHELIAAEADKFGAAVHWRHPDTATDKASSIHAVQEFLDAHREIDVVALIQCTCPFIRTEFLVQALHYIYSGRECVFSVTHSYKLRWSQLPSGAIQPLNFDPQNRPRRQDWAGEFIENGMFYFASRLLLKSGSFQNHE